MRRLSVVPNQAAADEQRPSTKLAAVHPTNRRLSRSHLLSGLRELRQLPQGAKAIGQELLLDFIGDPEIIRAFEALSS